MKKILAALLFALALVVFISWLHKPILFEYRIFVSNIEEGSKVPDIDHAFQYDESVIVHIRTIRDSEYQGEHAIRAISITGKGSAWSLGWEDLYLEYSLLDIAETINRRLEPLGVILRGTEA
jgi:hypothetical protein